MRGPKLPGGSLTFNSMEPVLVPLVKPFLPWDLHRETILCKEASHVYPIFITRGMHSVETHGWKTFISRVLRGHHMRMNGLGALTGVDLWGRRLSTGINLLGGNLVC